MANRNAIARTVSYLAVWAFIIIVLLLLAEGASSWALTFRALAFRETRVLHTQYDTMLGWGSTPGKVVLDAYGPGVDIRINSNGFRGNEVALGSEREQTRIVCSGDSFTFGQGVGTGEDWCHVMSELSEHVESVNMGQPGYGVDQAYLWFLRDGLSLKPDVHFFAFVSGDFWRMLSSERYGAGKPTLRVSGDSLEVMNVPVPSLKHSLGRVIDRAELRLVRLGRGLLGRLSNEQRPAPPGEVLRPIVSVLFEELASINARNGATTVFVFLPTQNEVSEDTPAYQMARSIANTLEVTFVDLTPQLRVLPAGEVGQMFLPDGHYSVLGHRWIAERLTARLRQVPELGSLLKPVPQSDH